MLLTQNNDVIVYIMTIFHVIKYSPLPDIFEQPELDTLPPEVITKWRRRVEDYAIEGAKSVVQLY